jgi:hypothetical protein
MSMCLSEGCNRLSRIKIGDLENRTQQTSAELSSDVLLVDAIFLLVHLWLAAQSGQGRLIA